MPIIVIAIKIHVHVILTVLQMIRALMCVDVIIIVHVIHKLWLALITVYVTLSVLLNMGVLVILSLAQTVVQTVLVSMYVLVKDIKLIAHVIISVVVTQYSHAPVITGAAVILF